MEEYIKIIVFKLREQHFGVDVQQVLSIEKYQEITSVPRTSDFIKGIINLRGETIPVIDLKERLQLESTELTEQTRILIVQAQDVQVGLIVDAATDVLDIDHSSIEQPPNIIGGVKDTFLGGVAKLKEELLLLVDLEQILNFEESNEIKEVVNASN
ncbi:chemotaxis protein CheW [Ornithinibacillus halophilus]|uniref:Purine-binding chemotaxis protein CheW n=1 Tax=Ornithinibacillus halophilus TaxID=930117 RepID=A0A1M5FFM3_9BACI|nr:chemotaxis protein CheW [Ornithinibacillus halophilus]SHF90340.1 purine-binding chemotaxis protein CheW [Ornithinibacillus halophilus]